MKILPFTIMMSTIICVLFLNNYSIAQTQMVTPDGGEAVSNGNILTISWKLHETDSLIPFKVSLWDGRTSKWLKIVDNCYSTEYRWFIPKYLVGDRYRVRIENEMTGSYIMSQTFFSIVTKENSTQSSVLYGSSESLKSLPSLHVFPNPTSDVLNLSWKGSIHKIAIRNTLGAIVYDKVMISKEQSTTVPTENMSSGVYFISIFYNDGNEETQKFTVQ